MADTEQETLDKQQEIREEQQAILEEAREIKSEVKGPNVAGRVFLGSLPERSWEWLGSSAGIWPDSVRESRLAADRKSGRERF